MAAASYPCNLPSPPLHRKIIFTGNTRIILSTVPMSRSGTNAVSTKVPGVIMAPPETLLQCSSDSLEYEQGKLGAVPDGVVSESSVGAMEYLTSILTSKVYDVAVESPLQHAVKLSARLGVDVWLKREDVQSVSLASILH